MKRIFIILNVCFVVTFSSAQQFINCDLIGPNITGPSVLPYSWQAVPLGNPCIATSPPQASPDLTDTNSPSAGMICGMPYSGPTFVSGLYGSGYQEGIEQTVSGFCVGCSYQVNFFQSTIKQIGHEDNTGCWSVYLDTILIGQTLSSINNNPIGANLNSWDFRCLTFNATSTIHTIKFLPSDDDTLWTHPYGSRMGIDSIYLTKSEISTVNNLENMKIIFYPNPVKGKLTVELSESSVYNLTLYDINQKVKTNLKGKSGMQLIDTSDLAKGIYVLVITCNSVIICEEKIIVE